MPPHGAPQARGGRAGPGMPPHGVPQAGGGRAGQGTPPQGVPRARGVGDATPAQGVPVFEGGQGRGRPGTPPHGVPAYGAAGRRAPGAVAGSAAAAAVQTPPGGVFVPRPRQEFIDAFDDDVYPAGASDPWMPDEEPALDDAEAGARRAKGGKGRALTGVAAAAVTTVLAVVVAGQMAGGDLTRSVSPATTDVPRKDDGDASRSDNRPTPSRPPAAPLTYAQKMAATYPLDEKLAGSGDFEAVGGHDKAPGKGQVVRYRVDVEKGLPLDGALFAQAVHKTLNDERSWGQGGTRTFERVSSGDADWVITLASPRTTATWCAKSGLDTTVDNVSCDSASTERIMINAYRWAQGAETYGDDKMFAYRQMLINHEVGHRLGHSHEGCTKTGALAPVMMQQTKYLATDGAICKPNPWPFPKS
ncbi:DUF3152 domain-containing protein [Streptomyces sp. 7N604]|uniref:DUF3152 domain-containing protein n=1 Tax=Streptomyces sp. 7N604 TaxID=3457415 RepID=UPI003FCFC1D1